MPLAKIYPISSRYYTNREKRRFNKKHKTVKMMAVNEMLASKSPVGIKDVFKMMLGMSRV